MQATSLAAYDAIRSTLTTREQAVWLALADCTTPPTAYELYQRMHTAGTAKDINDVRPRLTAMYEIGRHCIENVGKRPCTVTGKQAMTWRVLLAHPPQPSPETSVGHNVNVAPQGRLL